MALITSSSDRLRAVVGVEGVYPAAYGALVPAASGGVSTNIGDLQITGETLKFDLKTEASKILNPDRGVTDVSVINASVGGGVNCEHNYRNHDDLLRSALQNSWNTAYVPAALPTFTVAPDNVTLTFNSAPTGGAALTNLKVGQFFTLMPANGYSAGAKAHLKAKVFRVASVTSSTVLVLDSATPWVASKFAAGDSTAGAYLAGSKLSSTTLVNGVSPISLYMGLGSLDVNVWRHFNGLMVDTFGLAFGSEDLVKIDFGFMGKDMTLNAAPLYGSDTPIPALGSPSADSARGLVDFLFDGAQASSTIFLKSLKLNAKNNLRPVGAAGVFGAAGISSGKFNLEMDVEMYFTSPEQYNKFLTSQEFSMSFPILDKDGNGYVYEIPKCKWSEAGFNAGGEGQDMMLSGKVLGLMTQNAASVNDKVVFRITRVGA